MTTSRRSGAARATGSGASPQRPPGTRGPAVRSRGAAAPGVIGPYPNRHPDRRRSEEDNRHLKRFADAIVKFHGMTPEAREEAKPRRDEQIRRTKEKLDEGKPAASGLEDRAGPLSREAQPCPTARSWSMNNASVIPRSVSSLQG
jgi:hypothetical protein